MIPRPPSSTLFPYTTLFRSDQSINQLLSQRFDFLKVFASRCLRSIAIPLRFIEQHLWFSNCRGIRSEEHTSELQSHHDLVCRLLLEKKNLSNNKDMTRDSTI